jgi:predicted helicase
VDSFISESSKKISINTKDGNILDVAYASRIFVSTAKLNTNALDSLKNQNPAVNVITLEDLNNSELNWQEIWDDLTNKSNKLTYEIKKKEPRDYQTEAIDKVINGLAVSDRGKLIMACGSGKTFTALKIIEKFIADNISNNKEKKQHILFLVPSLSLLNQTLREFNNQQKIDFAYMAICSDSQIGKAQKDEEDTIEGELIYLSFPATTNSKDLLLAERYQQKNTIVISTYHSLDVLKEAQSQGYPDFDLVICDEAHKTVGISNKNNNKEVKNDKDESFFTLIHSNDNIKVKKRLYMTATPKIYKDVDKKKANDADLNYYSMDEKEIFGDLFYHLTFSKALEKGILTDYKVLILALDEKAIDDLYSKSDIKYSMESVKTKLNKQDLQLNDIAKIVGMFNALNGNIISSSDKEQDIIEPMKSAVAFCSTIALSKLIKEQFAHVINFFNENLDQNNHPQDNNQLKSNLKCSVEHIDGKMSNNQRVELLDWLKKSKDTESKDTDNCHILSNAKVLTEGIDVPSLDAIIFMNSKKSEVDIIQAVGRVMRKAPGKKFGYIILPIVISANEDENLALDNNEEYEKIWEVIKALKSHDEGFDIPIDQINFAKKTLSEKINIATLNIGSNGKKHKNTKEKQDSNNSLIDKNINNIKQQIELNLEIKEQLQHYKDQIFAKIVHKVGNKDYTLSIIENMKKAVEYAIANITELLKTDEEVKGEFNNFVEKLQQDINNTLTNNDVIDMLSTHIITKPIFNALFSENAFIKNNVVGMAMQGMLDILEKKKPNLINNDYLKSYSSLMAKKLTDVKTFKEKQSFIKNFYEEFIKKAFPKQADLHGITYTPIEVIDFIINSVECILNKEFNASFNHQGVNIIDPFSGTGTFITRLIQSGLLSDNLIYKYKNEIHANEILLFSYYVASINIESSIMEILKDKEDNKNGNNMAYLPFDGMVLTDTFNMAENEDRDYYKHSELSIKDNSEKITQQKNTPMMVIIGNPPYSVGQSNANDNNQNLKYPKLDKAIEDSYIKDSNLKNSNKLYDSYIRAIKWATLRLTQQKEGIVAFITNNYFLNGSSADGIRKNLLQDYNNIYVIDLKGNSRSAKEAKQEGGNIFDIRVGVCIIILVKNNSQQNNLYYYNIGDNLKKEEKLAQLKNLKSMENLEFELINPNNKHDWLNIRDEDSKYNSFILLGNKDKQNKELTIFANYSLGLVSSRDTWVFNYSKQKLTNNMANTIAFYNAELNRYQNQNNKDNPEVKNFINNDETKIKWSRDLINTLTKKNDLEFNEQSIITSLYRPFSKQYLYYDKNWNESQYQLPKIFKKNVNNIAFGTTGIGANKDFSTLITNIIPEHGVVHNGQWFSLYTFNENNNLFNDNTQLIENITDKAYEYFKEYYKENYKLTNWQNITKQDIFYYCFAILHNKKFKEKYKNELSKEMTRIPLLKDFFDYVAIGKKMADMLLNYENYEHNKLISVEQSQDYYIVDKIRYLNKDDKSTIIYNPYIKISNIPLKAYNYVVNGKSAIDWVLDRYKSENKKYSDIGLSNNCNDYAKEIGDDKYILNLLLSVISVSIEMVELIEQMDSYEII